MRMKSVDNEFEHACVYEINGSNNQLTIAHASLKHKHLQATRMWMLMYPDQNHDFKICKGFRVKSYPGTHDSNNKNNN